MMKPPVDPKRGLRALRWGRWSSPSTEYFLTICTARRERNLASPPMAGAILAQANQLDTQRAWQLRTLVVLPDYLHLLVSLGDANNLAESARLFKGRLAPVLRGANLRWQRGYFEHRMRSDEDRLPVFHYIFLNPYRAHLLPAHEKWPAYYCSPQDWNWFEPLTNSTCSFPEWLL